MVDFPQLRGLGHSRYSHLFGIAYRKEAEALLTNTNKSAVAIFGEIDAQR